MNKTLGKILGILAAVAAVGAIVYLIVTYYDKIINALLSAKEKVYACVSGYCDCDSLEEDFDEDFEVADEPAPAPESAE